ncbi:uncharacterized protein LY89DRAFT_742470 [Mollisia scopiformis]|uniref:ABM domain-containing protein n=1 Tax=Mollisia scopiformis TaxID=149040 RepID=A0A132B6S1_MOLSC|nr:uncharacterized protein LY89DRAFT_742470 [Mollisia scopiformis]KUJ07699.1 hypothetical protein LY89DRAFT_742470 [Mollisia scopiformis]
MASPYPVVEVAIINIKGQNVEDETTKEGKTWHEVFKKLISVPGFTRVGWGRSVRDHDTVIFGVDWESYQHHQDFMEAKGTFTSLLMDLLKHGAAFYAAFSAAVFLWGVDEEKFPSLVKPWITANEKSDSCLGYFWGEVKSPAKVDTSKNLELGKCVIMLSGWKSKETHDYDCGLSIVVDAYKALQAAVKKSDTYPIEFHCVEKSGMEMSWRRL